MQIEILCLMVYRYCGLNEINSSLFLFNICTESFTRGKKYFFSFFLCFAFSKFTFLQLYVPSAANGLHQIRGRMRKRDKRRLMTDNTMRAKGI